MTLLAIGRWYQRRRSTRPQRSTRRKLPHHRRDRPHRFSGRRRAEWWRVVDAHPAGHIVEMALAGVGVHALRRRSPAVARGRRALFRLRVGGPLVFLGFPVVPDLFMGVLQRRVRRAVRPFPVAVAVLGGLQGLLVRANRLVVRPGDGRGHVLAHLHCLLMLVRHGVLPWYDELPAPARYGPETRRPRVPPERHATLAAPGFRCLVADPPRRTVLGRRLAPPAPCLRTPPRRAAGGARRLAGRAGSRR